MVWNDMQWYSYSLPFLLMQTFWMDTHWMDPYWWDTCWRYVLVGYVLVGYVLRFLLMHTFWMDTHWMDTHSMDTYWWDTCWWDTYWWDTYCKTCWCKRFEWIRIAWIRTGGIRVERIRIGGIRIGGIRFEWICVGYVWCEICVGYVWCEIRQQSSEEPCDETSFGKNNSQLGLNSGVPSNFDDLMTGCCNFLASRCLSWFPRTRWSPTFPGHGNYHSCLNLTSGSACRGCEARVCHGVSTSACENKIWKRQPIGLLTTVAPSFLNLCLAAKVCMLRNRFISNLPAVKSTHFLQNICLDSWGFLDP